MCVLQGSNIAQSGKRGATSLRFLHCHDAQVLNVAICNEKGTRILLVRVNRRYKSTRVCLIVDSFPKSGQNVQGTQVQDELLRTVGPMSGAHAIHPKTTCASVQYVANGLQPGKQGATKLDFDIATNLSLPAWTGGKNQKIA